MIPDADMRVLLVSLVACAALWFPSRLSAQSVRFDVETPGSVFAPGGETAKFEAAVILDTRAIESSDGIEAWSVAITAESARIVSATTEGTAGAVAPDGLRLAFSSFELTELTTGLDNEGVVSAVILSLDDVGVTLPPSARFRILRLEVEADTPAVVTSGNGVEECEPLFTEIRFRDGLRGSAQPVRNLATYRGSSLLPTLAEPVITSLCPILDNEATYRVDVVGNDGAFGDAERREFFGDRFGWKVSVLPGQESIEVETAVRLVSDLSGLGAQGWSLSLRSDSELEILEVSVDGTAADLEAAGTDGFELTEIVDPAANGGQNGVVSAVVLCLSTCDVTLPPVSELPVLELSLLADTTSIENELDTIGPFSVQPAETDETGLVGSGQPVKTAIVVDGTSVVTDGVGAAIAFVGDRPRSFFRRGETNDDEQIDIGDAVYLLNFLFQSGEPLVCRSSGDVNDDGFLDVSDAVYVLQFQFTGGEAPPAPFPTCGMDPTHDALGCARQLQLCSGSGP
jgi:hypothetical protein